MLARMAKPNAQAVVTADIVIEGTDKSKLLHKRRGCFRNAAVELAADLAGQPGLSLRAAPDHDGIGARGLERADRTLIRGNIAVDDKRKASRLPHLAHCRPVRVALVELAARAPVHGNHLDADGFRAAGQVRRV